jgi:hypothetical protein
MSAKVVQWTEARYREYLKSGGNGSDLPAKAHIMGKERVVPAEWWALNGLPVPLYEFRFHETRKWRFDFYFPDVRLAIEVEGGASEYRRGRHMRAKGFLKDMEKYNAAAEQGIRVLRYQPGKINCQQIKKTIAYTMAMGWTAF